MTLSVSKFLFNDDPAATTNDELTDYWSISDVDVTCVPAGAFQVITTQNIASALRGDVMIGLSDREIKGRPRLNGMEGGLCPRRKYVHVPSASNDFGFAHNR